MWMYIIQSTSIKVIDHKFMVSGHSYLPNDSDFGITEHKKVKAMEIYTPEQWYKLISSCCKKNPYAVNRMDTDGFVSIKPLLEKTVNRKVT